MRIRQCPSAFVPVSVLDEEGNATMTVVDWDKTHSNFRAAIMLGKPETRAIISHGRRLALDVRTAPPLTWPLCCFNRLGGFGVDPM